MSAQADSKVDQQTASKAPADKGKGKAAAEDVSMGDEDESHSEGESEPEETVSTPVNRCFHTFTMLTINLSG